jgi:hypothetical protein
VEMPENVIFVLGEVEEHEKSLVYLLCSINY